MTPFYKKITSAFLRHPLFYYIRYILLSRNYKGKPDFIGCFNDVNSVYEIPELYFSVNASIPLLPEMDELEKALVIASYLRSKIRGGKGLGSSSENTLELMLAGHGGVCSDFSQIFNIFCLINNIRVKEWGCVDRFYKSRFGHSFNEIYSTHHQKWIAIDVHKNILFNDAEGNIFSAIELFNYLRKGMKLKFRLFSAYIPNKLDRLPYVYSKDTIPFLITNYRNQVNDYFFDKFRKLPPFIINVLIILSGKNHDFVFVMDDYKTKLLPQSFKVSN